jgi:hypothetical protein
MKNGNGGISMKAEFTHPDMNLVMELEDLK